MAGKGDLVAKYLSFNDGLGEICTAGLGAFRRAATVGQDQPFTHTAHLKAAIHGMD